MNPDVVSPQGEHIPINLDVLDAENDPLVFYVVSHAHALDNVSNAELRAMGIMNFPGREVGLPD